MPRLIEFAGMLANPQEVWAFGFTMSGVVVLHFGVFLGVKAATNPPRFWARMGNHLAAASVISWALTALLFVTFSFLP